ncbi:MAG: hypothetical protein R3C40_10285 [Parvularculaceae bacterium]
MENTERKIYGVQFHPEVAHTPDGAKTVGQFRAQHCGAGRRLVDEPARRGDQRNSQTGRRCARHLRAFRRR